MKKGILTTIGIMSLTLISFVMGLLIAQLNSAEFITKEISDNSPFEKPSPQNRIQKEQIKVFKNHIRIDIPNVKWAEFTDTNSMDPIIDIEANSFEIKPQSPNEIKPGDIISYKSTNSHSLIVHRVIEISEDEKGWYATAKGDNLDKKDSQKIRFDQVNGVLVGIIY